MIRTERLLLRGWRDDDVAPFLALCTDPEVMRYFPAVMTLEQVEEFVDRHRRLLEEGQPGLFAVDLADSGELIGFVGLAVPQHPLPFQPCVEIGWRLARPAWGNGYATEAARASLRHGFEALGLDEVVSFTAVVNVPSQQVMRRIGMHRDPREDFDHPALPRGHELSRHVLYRIGAREWRWSQAAR